MKKKRKSWNLILLGLLLFLIVVIIIAVSLGAVDISLSNVIKTLLSKVPFLQELVNASDLGVKETIIYEIRLPRVLLAGLVGLALATSGTVFQALLKNPMADPYVIGISSGASLGATLGLVLDLEFKFLALNTIPLFAFLGAVITVFVVYKLAKVGDKISVSTLLLAGVAVGAFLSALVSLLMVFNNDSMQQIVYWMMGSLSSKGWQQVQMIWLYIIGGYVITHLFAKDLNVLLLGAETAQSLGLEVESIKKILLVTASLLAGAAVAGSGIIGFVGLIIPHLVRLLVGPDHRILIPSSALVGAIFLIGTDIFARTVIAPTEIPVGIITSLFGGPFFLYLLNKKKKTAGF
ncbi:MAG: iron chelate uptake ABC transporter family permease subunit [Halanaerobacter sp.]